MLLTAAQHLAYSLHVAMSLGRGPPVHAVATLFFLSLLSGCACFVSTKYCLLRLLWHYFVLCCSHFFSFFNVHNLWRDNILVKHELVGGTVHKLKLFFFEPKQINEVQFYKWLCVCLTYFKRPVFLLLSNKDVCCQDSRYL